MSERNERIRVLSEKDEAEGLSTDEYRQLDELRADRREDVEIEADTMAAAMFHAFEDMAAGLTCDEVESVVDLYRVLGREGDADTIMLAHSYGDTEPEDRHPNLSA